MRKSVPGFLFALLCVVTLPAAAAPPAWLRDLAAVPVATQPPDVDAVQLLLDVSLKVTSDGRLHRRVRCAYRVLRQSGESRALLKVSYNTWSRVSAMQGWTIPAVGKPFEAKYKEAVDTAIDDVDDSSLISDVRTKMLLVPGAHPGATVGYEYETEEDGLELADFIDFQDVIPVVEANYSLELPPGWTVTAEWLNHAPVQASQDKPQHWQWMLRDLPAISLETRMPPWSAVAAQLYLAFSPPDSVPQLASWPGISAWAANLASDRRVASPAIRAKVAELVQGTTTPLERLSALAYYVQRDIRYVAIELGIGGYQPHAAADVFTNRFGDCKDKATLLSVMLAEAGMDSTLVLINATRDPVSAESPPRPWLFNHMILAVRIPPDTPGDGLFAAIDSPDGGRLLFFDPTDEVTPVGRLPGELQGAFGLPATREGAQPVQLPRVPPSENGVQRTGQLKLNEAGDLSGEVLELYRGDAARRQRYALRAVTRDTDVIKPLQARLATSLARFQIEKATIRYRTSLQQPFEWNYTVQAGAYASRSGGLLLVRPRILGVLAEDLSEERLPRVHDVSFSEVGLVQDEFTIELPAGYIVDSLPEPVDVDIGFAAYHSRVQMVGTRLKYTRSYELRELRVPATRFGDYLQLHRMIARDERAVAMLKPDK